MKYILVFLIMLSGRAGQSQSIKMLTSGNKVSLRGLSVVNDKIVWASGSGGTVVKSTDGGLTWNWMKVAGFEKSDFRDIEAFDSLTAVVIAIAEPAYILRTTDGGKTWNEVYRNATKGMFLDAIDFYDNQHGIAVGDPINGKFFLTKTADGGKTWIDVPDRERPAADSGEACFASSGTNIRMTSKHSYSMVSGGLVSNYITAKKKFRLPLVKGKESTGGNSVASAGGRIMIAGGDFTTKDSSAHAFACSHDGGQTWVEPAAAPRGYRSCIEYIGRKTWITCGLNGADISFDNGEHFLPISAESFNVCRKSKKGNAVFFAGGGGRIGKFEIASKP